VLSRAISACISVPWVVSRHSAAAGRTLWAGTVGRAGGYPDMGPPKSCRPDGDQRMFGSWMEKIRLAECAETRWRTGVTELIFRNWWNCRRPGRTQSLSYSRSVHRRKTTALIRRRACWLQKRSTGGKSRGDFSSSELAEPSRTGKIYLWKFATWQVRDYYFPDANEKNSLSYGTAIRSVNFSFPEKTYWHIALKRFGTTQLDSVPADMKDSEMSVPKRKMMMRPDLAVVDGSRNPDFRRVV